MHHDSHKVFYDNYYLIFPICDRKEFGIFQLLENLKKNVLMHHPVAKDRPCAPNSYHECQNASFSLHWCGLNATIIRLASHLCISNFKVTYIAPGNLFAIYFSSFHLAFYSSEKGWYTFQFHDDIICLVLFSASVCLNNRIFLKIEEISRTNATTEK
jgi:hypothetical protein